MGNSSFWPNALLSCWQFLQWVPCPSWLQIDSSMKLQNSRIITWVWRVEPGPYLQIIKLSDIKQTIEQNNKSAGKGTYAIHKLRVKFVFKHRTSHPFPQFRPLLFAAPQYVFQSPLSIQPWKYETSENISLFVMWTIVKTSASTKKCKAGTTQARIIY